jgi:hypothetical protein
MPAPKSRSCPRRRYTRQSDYTWRRISTAICMACQAGSSRGGVVEEDHQTVAGEAHQCVLVLEDDRPERAKVLAQHADHILRLDRLGEVDEAARVAEDGRHLAAVTVKDALVAGLEHDADHLGCEETARSVAPLVLSHLCGDLLLLRPVPPTSSRQILLAGDLVVHALALQTGADAGA